MDALTKYHANPLIRFCDILHASLHFSLRVPQEERSWGHHIKMVHGQIHKVTKTDRIHHLVRCAQISQ